MHDISNLYTSVNICINSGLTFIEIWADFFVCIRNPVEENRENTNS